MVKVKYAVFAVLISAFLLFSFYPTIFELSRANRLADPAREFILEHNYYWPDYNLYLSKIRQGLEGRFTAMEKYTSETHRGSLIQEFYVILGWLGKIFSLDPNTSYLLGRAILSPLLLLVILLLVRYYFKSFAWQVLAFIITVSSASFPRIFTDPAGATHIGRFMEWWSNIDALQRITFIPHILFGQAASFYLLYRLSMKQFNNLTIKQWVFYILLGNIVGLTFPPSLITLNSVILLTLIIKRGGTKDRKENFAGRSMLFIFFTLPSLLYIFLITKFIPWSALVDFHRTHPMMIPFDQYILGTGPVFFLGLAGAVLSIINRDRKFQPLIFWVLSTFAFAAIFSVVRDQSPLRFTQTGLFIPLGILGTYLFYQLFHLSDLGNLSDLNRSQIKAGLIIVLSFYLLGSLYMMKISLDWQTTWITQRIGAGVPLVPYPPQAMYPLRAWMDGIRWLRDNTNHNDVVLAGITAGNHIPAYSGNTVYFGQANTVDYERKQLEIDNFFSGKMTPTQAELFLKNGRIKYVFFSIQEKEKSGGKNLEDLYSLLKPVYKNPSVTIYSVNSN